jgi:hypothetical protein
VDVLFHLSSLYEQAMRALSNKWPRKLLQDQTLQIEKSISFTAGISQVETVGKEMTGSKKKNEGCLLSKYVFP